MMRKDRASIKQSSCQNIWREREKTKEWPCMHAEHEWCEKYMEREKEEKHMDACIHAGISHGLACGESLTI